MLKNLNYQGRDTDINEKIFVVYAEPVGKTNMKPIRMGNHLSLCQTTGNYNYMTLVKNAYLEKFGTEMFDEKSQLKMRINAYYSIPKNTPKYKIKLMHQGLLRPTKKPDCDNISKIVCDALNGLAFKDDSSIVTLIVRKWFADQPCVMVKIEEVNDNVEDE